MRYLTPGPTQLHPVVDPAIKTALQGGVCSISHRSQEFQDIYARAESGVKEVLKVPHDWHVFFVSSATEAMERIVQNGVREGGRSFHFVNGAFSERFYNTAQQLGVSASAQTVSAGDGYAVRAATIPYDVELISLALNETSTGVWTKATDITYLKEQYPEALISLDIVSAVPYAAVPFVDIDVTFFSVQKGFGLPAGLGVLLVSPRAYAAAGQKAARGESVGSYHSFLIMAEQAKKHYTNETPNVLGLYLLGEVCEALLTEKLATIRLETDAKAKFLYDALEQMNYQCLVASPDLRSPVTIVVKTPQTHELQARARNAGIVLGAGYGALQEETLRIANFPMHTREDMEQVVDLFKA